MDTRTFSLNMLSCFLTSEIPNYISRPTLGEDSCEFPRKIGLVNYKRQLLLSEHMNLLVNIKSVIIHVTGKESYKRIIVVSCYSS